ncbi:MAG: glutamine--fructose-6-phosphate transaminase (isomerizing) [Gammaproteobacteria bacterium]|nr:glutamine--fructose-6-phosphate transaminase (isomerizing) [Gammaproteobacteria bacterium]MDP6164904.1 glutamine--fructose-6-phosphate transaminase (isomerizing) [Gammaproteobacteria bacterium]
MCGIVGAIAQRNVAGILIEGLNRLEYRGYDSAGLAVYDQQTMQCLRRAGKVAQLEQAIADHPISGSLGIAHTRWATHGVPNENNAHPHLSQDDVAVVHNGIITNFEPIKQSLIENGYGFASDTDSEVIAHLIHSHRAQGMDLRHAVQAAVVQCEGAYALGVIDRHEPTSLLCARKGSPLVIGVGVAENYIASDQLALLQVTDRFIFLEEGDIAQLEQDSIQVWDTHGEVAARNVERYEHGDQSSDKGQYKHYMAKEIHEQPKVIDHIISDRSDMHGEVHIPLDKEALAKLEQACQVLIIACGTSYYAGLVARYWIESVAGVSCQVEVASEFRYRNAVVPEGTLLVTLSQSGETADTLAALRHVDKSKLVAAMTICNVPSSSLVRESDFALLIQAGPEIGVASTKAFTTQLVALLQLTLTLAKTRTTCDIQEVMQAMQSLPGLLNQVLQYEDRIEQLAKCFADKHHALFLGRGALFPIALEGALKLKEISYIHAEAYPAGELKHGPLALVDAEMPVVVVAPNNDLLDKLKANMQEVRARGGELFVFADSRATLAADENTHIIALPEIHDLLAPILYTIPLQLLSYHVALIKGTDVDQPRNLAKSVTVE